MKWFVLALVVISFSLVAFGCSKEDKGKSAEVGHLLEGKPAPNFTIKDPDGRDVALSSLRGKVVFLNFWATWCPPCKEEIPSMMKLNQKMNGQPFQMLAVSIDEGGRDAVVSFFKKTGFNLPYLNDPEQKVGKMYGITGVPETFVIDKNGILVKKVIGGMDWASPESVQLFSDLAAK
ncbi:thiol-disulfide oxidoreductase ResA [Geobacter sp. OR-1]|uniref:TlpA disulfide reductase family protein n=1 Tax=Geobacter sp. OR-1 TaxID=1266765 RepID=UPI00054314A3|nr:TlpA disulfide reductase family protein [Geobacter sp. OR-1]GAM07860.1 thiol-disulfide oxidoreductase ResA [Geobacter sp. OR-1]